MVMSLQGTNSTQERHVRVTAGQTTVAYTVNSQYVGQRNEFFCQSLHNSEALLTYGYPKEINLTLMLQKLGRIDAVSFGVLLCGRVLCFYDCFLIICKRIC